MHEKVDNLIALSLSELRRLWQELWGREPHRYITRRMLERSILFKQTELRGEGLSADQQVRLRQLIKKYKRNPLSFSQDDSALKPGLRLIKSVNGKKHVVTVKDDGLFDYNGKVYPSLSQVAFIITGTKWNGWLFFGLKKRG